MLKMMLAVVTTCLLVTSAFAGPVLLSDNQLDSVAAGGVDRVSGFVCPVITTDAVLNAKNGGALGIEGFYTIGGPDVMVPIHATNGAGNGNNPGGPFSQPGDTDYTAIWARGQ